MVTRRLVRWTARLVAGVLLCVQGAFAFGACGLPVREPARAIADMNPPPCHEPEATAGGLCVLHCLSDQQSLDKPGLQPAAIGEASLLVVALPRPETGPSAQVLRRSVAPHAPPPRILFQSFLI